MARVTVEDCLARVPNRFALTILGSRRARALSESRGHALVECDNKEGVTALREIGGDRVRFKEDVDSTMAEFIEEQRRQLRVTTGEHTFLEAASLRAFEDDDDGDDIEEADVEELQSDPEALNKQAKGEATDEDDDDGDSGNEPEGTEETTEGEDDGDSEGEGEGVLGGEGFDGEGDDTGEDEEGGETPEA